MSAMKLFVDCGAEFIRSNFIRHIHGLGKKCKVDNSDKLSYSYPRSMTSIWMLRGSNGISGEF
jgi:dTDP-D-glucose 4,6-dehydratase